MTDHEKSEDLALDRLRAADPAVGSGVDLTRLRAVVDARIAAEAGGDGLAPVTDLTHAPSRRTRWLRVAAAAAGAVVIGAAGFGLGKVTPGNDGGRDQGGAAVSTVPQGEAADSAAGSTAALDESRMSYPGSWSHTTFRAVGLPSDAGTATTWAFDATGAFTAERVAEVAAALGIEGEPALVDGSWQVGTTDGTGAYLLVYPDGQAGMNFYDPAADPWNCQVGDSGKDAVECPRSDLGTAPGDDEARQLTRDLLGELGLDPDAFEYEVSKDEGAGWISVAANQVLDGNRTGTAWWASFTGAGLQSLSGSLATLVELGDYPVVGAEEAVSRITDPRFGTLNAYSILAAENVRDTAVAESGVAEGTAIAPVPSTDPPVPPAAGAAVPWPVEDVAITSAELGVAQYTTPDGAALLVPAWVLSADDGRSWTVLALAADVLDMAP